MVICNHTTSASRPDSTVQATGALLASVRNSVGAIRITHPLATAELASLGMQLTAMLPWTCLYLVCAHASPLGCRALNTRIQLQACYGGLHVTSVRMCFCSSNKRLAQMSAGEGGTLTFSSAG